MAISVGRRVAVSAAVVAAIIAGLSTTQFAIGKKKISPPAAWTEKTGGPCPESAYLWSAARRSGTSNPTGVDKWIDLQLHPEKIDDSALDARLASFRTLRMDTRAIVENFPNNQVIKQVAEGKAPMPTDPAQRAVYEAQVEKYEDKQDRKAAPTTVRQARPPQMPPAIAIPQCL